MATHGRSGSTTSSTSGRSSCAGAVTVAQLPLEHLARRVARQLVQRAHLARHGELRQLVLDQVLQLLLVDRRAGGRDDVRHQPGAPLSSGTSTTATSATDVVRVQHVLDLPG
jgi:hypothetical protein